MLRFSELDNVNEYVALGSSFAAGLGLGSRAPNSPCVCMRSINGYPQQLAKLLDCSLFDMSCSGATARQVLHGGQFFQSAQINAVSNLTKLVTITAGGNDVSYVRDLTLLGYQHKSSLFKFISRLVWNGPKAPEMRAFAAFGATLRRIICTVQQRAPDAHVAVVLYPPILPPGGSCLALGLSETDAKIMRLVGDKLADVTREAAKDCGAIVVDIALTGAGHDACARLPWVNGIAPASGAPFHPTLAGAEATAREIVRVLNKTQ